MDFLLDYGDISIKTSPTDNTLYDFDLEDDNYYIPKLIRRTLETPINYIKLLTSHNNNLLSIDGKYGSNLYQKLGEPFTNSIVEEMRSGINVALAILDIEDLVINSVNIISFSINSVEIQVNYTYKDKVDNYQSSFSL